MAIDGGEALRLLEKIDNKNAKGEFYLTDVVELARADGRETRVVIADETEVLGVNDRIQLAQAEAVAQTRLRRAAMAGGRDDDRAGDGFSLRRHRDRPRRDDRAACRHRPGRRNRRRRGDPRLLAS